MSKTNARPSLAERLAAVAGPQVPVTEVIRKEAAPPPEMKVQAPRVKKMPVPEVAAPTPAPASTTTPARIGKVMIAGYFSPQMAKAVKLLAVERDTTVQALIGEGLDAVLHKHGKHPMGER